MELADILSEESVIVCSGIKTKLDVLHRLSERAAKITGQDAATIFEAVNDREQLGSTGLGNGIAIPHGKFPGLGSVTVDAINGNDFATLRTMVYVGALLFVGAQIVTDLCYVLVDPRVRLR